MARRCTLKASENKIVDDEPPRLLDRHLYVPHYLSLIGNGLIARGSRDYLNRYGVGLNEARIVGVLGHSPGMTPGQLATAMGINKSIISRSIATMVEQGLVEQAGTARALKPRLTEAGWALHHKIVIVALAREEQLLAGFDADEKEMLLRLLRRLLHNVVEIRANARRATPAVVQET